MKQLPFEGDDWYYVEPDGTIAVNCWCDKEVVYVSLNQFRKGLTGSCRRESCGNKTSVAV